MIMKANRLFEIIYILLNKKSITAKELAEQFGVSTRTVYRDIDVLSLAGIPVYTETGKSGGISLLPDFVLNKSLLSEQEQNEILTALQGLSHIKATETEQILQKVSSLFKKATGNWIKVDYLNWGPKGEVYWNSLKTAILERRIIEFEYYSTYCEKTYRRVEPIQIWFNTRAWYLKGFCLTRDSIRTFKLTRVRNLIITNKTFEERDYSEIQSHSGSLEHHRPNVTIRLRIAPEMVYRVLDEFGGNVEEIQPDGSYIISVTWPENNWVYGVILSFGEYADVLEPRYVKDIIRDKAKKIFEKYL